MVCSNILESVFPTRNFRLRALFFVKKQLFLVNQYDKEGLRQKGVKIKG